MRRASSLPTCSRRSTPRSRGPAAARSRPVLRLPIAGRPASRSETDPSGRLQRAGPRGRPATFLPALDLIASVEGDVTAEPELVHAPALEMRGITKRYPGVVANDGIDLDVRPGEIHALLGENGAGKTTLMNILYGLARPDEGQILLDGHEVALTGPSDAIAHGISMVHQHFMLVPVLSVADNIVLGEESMANPLFLDTREANRRIIELGRRFGFEVDPEA